MTKKRYDEIIENEWTSLRSLWEGCRASVKDDEIRQEIDALFKREGREGLSEARDWHDLNLAEQRVGAHLLPAQLDAEYQCLLDIARERKEMFLTAYEERAKLFANPTPEVLDQQRAVYLSLLQRLQSSFIEKRFQRQLRRETAKRLFFVGSCILALAVLPLALFFGWLRYHGYPVDKDEHHWLFYLEPVIGLTAIIAFGALGAFFSRAMQFQQKLATLVFDDVMNLYQTRVLLLRFLFGSIGAIVFYFVLRGQLISGSLFPNLSQGSVNENYFGGFFPPGGLTISAPLMELAKLLAWSFIAGFSERLVPDVLERAEAATEKSGA
jgi:hypothetical protein